MFFEEQLKTGNIITRAAAKRIRQIENHDIGTKEHLWTEFARLQDEAHVKLSPTHLYRTSWHLKEEIALQDVIRRANIHITE